MSGSKNIKERAPNSYNFQKKKAKMINVIKLKAVKMKSRTARAVHNIVALFRDIFSITTMDMVKIMLDDSCCVKGRSKSVRTCRKYIRKWVARKSMEIDLWRWKYKKNKNKSHATISKKDQYFLMNRKPNFAFSCIGNIGQLSFSHKKYISLISLHKPISSQHKRKATEAYSGSQKFCLKKKL